MPIKILEPEVVSKIAAGGVRMVLPDRYDVIPTKCAKCGNDIIKRKELRMGGKYGLMGPAHKFDVYVCQHCGYSELFFKKASWLA